jgi:hypothetical protein
VVRVAITPVRVEPETRDEITRLRFRVAGEIGRNVTMGEMVALLIDVGKRHYPEIIAEAEKRFNSE